MRSPARLIPARRLALALAALLTAVFAIAAERGEAMAVLGSKFGGQDPAPASGSTTRATP